MIQHSKPIHKIARIDHRNNFELLAILLHLELVYWANAVKFSVKLIKYQMHTNLWDVQYKSPPTELIFAFLFAFTATGVVQCGDRKTSSRTSTIVQFMFHFWSFEISEHIPRNQKSLIGLDSHYWQLFIYLDPILKYISLWMTAYLKFTNLHYVFFLLSLQGHYRVTGENLLFETA